MPKATITLLVVENAIIGALGNNPPNRPAKQTTLALAEQIDRLQDRGTDLDQLIKTAVQSKLQARPVDPYVATLKHLFETLHQGRTGRTRYDRICTKRSRPTFHASTA